MRLGNGASMELGGSGAELGKAGARGLRGSTGERGHRGAGAGGQGWWGVGLECLGLMKMELGSRSI